MPIGMPKPGVSVSISITEPATKAMMPPMPSAPKLGSRASATSIAKPSTINATPA